jgi:murein L,D-transpeptidase YcbB/YkuD
MGTKQGGKTASRLGSGDWNGDGVMNDNYYTVLHNCRIAETPGVILEHSFHTNTRSTKWLLDKGNLQKLAEVEAKVIAEYFGIAAQPEAKPAADVCTISLPVLRKGSKGSSVKAMQQLLIAKGCNCGGYGADSNFGSGTEGAVIEFQRKYNLEKDGVCGPKTWAKLLGV